MSSKRALLSVYDKSNIVELARFLQEHNFELLSSGGTYRLLKDSKIEVKPVSDITGFPEILNGRVKTLHPNIHGGILAKRTQDHLDELNAHDIMAIDLVVVNLYPFEETISRQGVTAEEAIEQIDIGGPTMIRAAAKNHAHVTVLSNAGQYADFMKLYAENNGVIPADFRIQCAVEVFKTMARYDALIAEYLQKQLDTEQLIVSPFTLSGILEQKLRYGENPHQTAGFFRAGTGSPLGGMQQLHGKELSFNNILDLQAALSIVSEFNAPACVIIKHNNPCGVGVGSSLAEAHERARKTDQTSAFGGIISVNGQVTIELAEAFAGYFVECIIAPEFTEEALQRLTRKKNLRLLTYNKQAFKPVHADIKMISGGFLVQDSDRSGESVRESRVVTERAPSESEWDALDFAWRIVRHVKSNAIIFTNAHQTLGIGAGQMSRVDSTEIAIMKARQAGLTLEGSAVASDAFFPFKDSIEALARAGAKVVVEPGGSIRDEEVIQAADEAGIAMVFTGMRHFKH